MTKRLSLVWLAALVLAAPAAGADIVVGLAVKHGPLQIGRASALSPVGSGRIAVQLADARGTGNGWVLAATRIPSGSARVVVESVEVDCAHHSTCTLPRTNIRYPMTLSGEGAVAVLTARRGTGMGAITVVLTLAAPVRSSGVPAFSLHPA